MNIFTKAQTMTNEECKAVKEVEDAAKEIRDWMDSSDGSRAIKDVADKAGSYSAQSGSKSNGSPEVLNKKFK
jgi:hypothetical protein